ncbi:MAG: helix-turn-helix transcriptional regulator [Betaproteobacteria bacterium]|nr:helix-turn-helix transcriptional regulator [Betaproteobacteria bacterium]
MPIMSLTERERSILRWLSEGRRDREIGPLMGLRSRSVTRIVLEICDKLNARTRAQAVCMFIREVTDLDLQDVPDENYSYADHDRARARVHDARVQAG